MDVKVNGVTITLTKEQLAEIAKQTGQIFSIDDINSIEDAEKVLTNTKHIQYTQSQFARAKDWISYQIETIIKAVNYLSNNNEIWEPNFNDSNEIKYTPYFKKVRGVWGDDGYSVWYCDADHGDGFYFKKKDDCLKIAKKFIKLYCEWLPK